MLSTLVFVSAALASTPDGSTPAEESVCDDYSGASYGLCVAYCEATDCDSDSPKASENACDTLHDKFVDKAGEEPPCAEITYTVRVIYSGDDTVYAYLDGTAFAAESGDTSWSQETVQTLSLGSGDYTFAFEVNDVARAYTGLGVAIEVDGVIVATSDDGTFVGTTTDPGNSFADPSFDDSSWSTANSCLYDPWNSSGLAELDAAGATWVWADGGTCLYSSAMPNGWFRTTLSLP